jgi:ADP-ribosylglycohydrolase
MHGSTRRSIAPIAEAAAAQLRSGSRVSCQDTVPFALWCAAAPVESFEAAIWLTLSGLGDCGTTAAIVGGIVALRTGVDRISLRPDRTAC